MQVNYFLICEAAALAADGKQILHGIFDIIGSASFPTMHPVLYLAGEIFDCPSESNAGNISIKKKGDEHPIFSQDMQIQAAPARGTVGGLRAGLLFRMSPLPIPSPGEYEIILKINGEVAKITRFNAFQTT